MKIFFLLLFKDASYAKIIKHAKRRDALKGRSLHPASHSWNGKGVGDGTEGMCSWCRKNQQMWVCKCLSCSNKKRKCPKFCGHWYYKQLFSCKKKKGSNADGDGNYAKLPGFQDDKDLNR